MILLDSDILIDMFRKNAPALEWLEQAGDEVLAVPGYVAMEVIQGCQTKGAVRATTVELANYRRVWLTPDAAEHAYQLYCSVHPGTGLGLLDAMIGQTALMLNAPLHTFNVKHYRAVPNLQTIQPYNREVI